MSLRKETLNSFPSYVYHHVVPYGRNTFLNGTHGPRFHGCLCWRRYLHLRCSKALATVPLLLLPMLLLSHLQWGRGEEEGYDRSGRWSSKSALKRPAELKNLLCRSLISQDKWLSYLCKAVQIPLFVLPSKELRNNRQLSKAAPPEARTGMTSGVQSLCNWSLEYGRAFMEPLLKTSHQPVN